MAEREMWEESWERREFAVTDDIFVQLHIGRGKSVRASLQSLAPLLQTSEAGQHQSMCQEKISQNHQSREE
jgi:hypothetical protein